TRSITGGNESNFVPLVWFGLKRLDNAVRLSASGGYGVKTSIVAVIAASVFLAAAYLGLGSAWKPPGPPQMIVLSGPSSGTASPTTVDLPASPSSSPVGSSQVLAVGREAQQGSLKDLAAPRGAAPACSTSSAGRQPDS